MSTAIIILLLTGYTIYAVRKMVRNKRTGNCCGGCSGCTTGNRVCKR